MSKKRTTPQNRVPEGMGRLEGIRQMVDSYQHATHDKEPSVTDFIRLVGLERDLKGEETVREVKVTWVRSFETEFDM